MKVLFIHPNILGRPEIPIGIPILQTCLQQNAHEAAVFDLSNYPLESHDELKVVFGQFKSVVRRKKSEKISAKEDLLELVEEFRPELIGVSSMSANFYKAMELVSAVKERHQIPVIIGGPHPSVVPEETIANKFVDMVCVGEGEEGIVDLCNRMQQNGDITNIPNIWIKKNGKIYRNPVRPFVSMDRIPFQDYSGFEEDNMFRPLAGKLYKMASIEMSRGCPYECTYCVNKKMKEIYKDKGSYHREKSVDRTIEEILFLRDKYKVNMVRFWDECFLFMSKKRLMEFYEKYTNYVRLPFLIYCRATHVREENIKVLKKAGCATIAIGIETGSPQIRENMLNRKMSNEKIIAAFDAIRKEGIRVSSYNMLGIPGETRKHIFQTIELNRKCKPASSSVVFLNPYPGTKIREFAISKGYMSPTDYVKGDFYDVPLNMPQISERELKGLLKTFYVYTKVPKILFPVVRFCENDNKIANLIFKFLVWIVNLRD